MSSFGTTSLCLALSLALPILSGKALAFELGTCALIQVDHDGSVKANDLLIAVDSAVLDKEVQETGKAEPAQQTDLADFTFDSTNSIGSEFNTSKFNVPSDTGTREDSSLLDFSTDSSGF